MKRSPRSSGRMSHHWKLVTGVVLDQKQFCWCGFRAPCYQMPVYIFFLSVNSYGEDEDLTTSSDSDDEVIKQFEISVSRSQSFRSGVSEKGTQVGSECRPKFNRLLSNHEEYSTEASECEGTNRLFVFWKLKKKCMRGTCMKGTFTTECGLIQFLWLLRKLHIPWPAPLDQGWSIGDHPIDPFFR